MGGYTPGKETRMSSNLCAPERTEFSTHESTLSLKIVV